MSPELHSALRRLASGAVAVAGATDLLAGGGLPEEGEVVDLLALSELRGIRPRTDGGLTIGATTTMTELGSSQLVRAHYPVLAAAAAVVGGWQIQNRATIGGNVANASPAGDTLPALLALDATVELASARGRRTVPYDTFHEGYRATACRDDELITAFHLPPWRGSEQRYRKVGTRAAQAISKLVVALVATVSDGRVETVRITAGSVAPTPVRLRSAEEALVGQSPAQVAAAVATAAAAEVDPIDDVRSTAHYRREVLRRVVLRLVSSLG